MTRTITKLLLKKKTNKMENYNNDHKRNFFGITLVVILVIGFVIYLLPNKDEITDLSPEETSDYMQESNPETPSSDSDQSISSDESNSDSFYSETQADIDSFNSELDDINLDDLEL